MHRRSFTLVEMLLVVAIIAVVAAVARAGQPTTKTLTLPGGGTNVVSSSYSTGLARDVYSSFKPLAYEVDITGTRGANVCTVSIKKSASGPTYKTITVATNGADPSVTFETNDYYFLAGDTFYASFSVTNAGTLTIIGEEQ